MKHKIVLSVLAAIVIFAATTSAEAGIFGRLSVVWNGCSPCEPVACQPCEPIACEPVACQPCPPVACLPCPPVAPCEPCGVGCRPFRPLGGFFANAKARLAALHCSPCEPIACQPCEPIVCQPCEPIACNPCDVACGPRLPFNGFFLNLKARMAAACTPCTPISCAPCEPICEPCAVCR